MPSMFFPEIESLRTTQPLVAEAMQKLVSLVAPTAVNTSGQGNPNGVIYGNPNQVFVQTDDTTGAPQWVKTGPAGTNTGWVKLATSANQVSGEVPVNRGDNKTYTLANNAVPNTVQIYVNGSRTSLPFTVLNKRITFTAPLASTDKVLVDYVQAISQ